MPFKIIRNDITKVAADAIVNTANPDPVYASGTDEAIYRAAGVQELLKERKKIGKILPGEAAATGAFRLNARYIIHTVGPVWKGGTNSEFDILASCYRKSLHLAKILGCASIAFPLISTGVYGFPKDRALDIALTEFRNFLDSEEMEITLVVYDRNALELSSELVENVEQYIDEKYVQEHSAGAGILSDLRLESARSEQGRGRRGEGRERRKSFADRINASKVPQSFEAEAAPQINIPQSSDQAKVPQSSDRSSDRKIPQSSDRKRKSARSLQDIIRNVGESFQEMLLRMIDERGLTDPEVYKGANIDRKLFSKIRCNAAYKPGKKTVLALAIAMKLSLDETVDLLARAGYALSPGSKADLIISFCIENRIYNIMEIDALLFKYGEQTLS